MTARRFAAAVAAILTVLLLQATLISPLVPAVPLSLPAVIVASVALTSGPGAGIAFGFSAGLLADLGSEHPAGVLALCWLGIGVLCGVMSSQRRRLRDAAVGCGIVCGVASGAVGLLLTALGSSGATAWASVEGIVPAALGDVLMAACALPAVGALLRGDALRARAAIPARSARPILAGRRD